ncbi:MAG TPA: neutral zinc metallopeptidase [Gemmatimonadaceae bacterium]|nr:neutral zinc metallopeptidase [Gemmatimonadaceae bacterium]
MRIHVRHLALGALVAASTAFAAPVASDVTEQDVAASNAKVVMAYNALVAMWGDDFAQRGVRFAPPALVRYRGAVRTACGVMNGNNAAYCTARNTIYFDDVFVARQAKDAARDLGTDGDMAAVGIIAHEMGHAVAIQLGADSPVPYYNEATADCLAGAFTRRSAQDGSLEPGDLDEAFHGLAAAGDPTPQLTGNRRIDARITYRAALMGHGTREQRLANFRAGYDRGAGACLSELAS